jgi:hypothetical protein
LICINDDSIVSFILFFISHSLFITCRLVETLKDYAIKALINTVDHLGSVAYKVSDLLDEKVSEVCGEELRLSCIEQVCLDFV